MNLQLEFSISFEYRKTKPSRFLEPRTVPDSYVSQVTGAEILEYTEKLVTTSNLSSFLDWLLDLVI